MCLSHSMLLLEQTSIIASAYLTNWYQSHMKQMASGMYLFQVPQLKKRKKKEKKRQLL